MYSNQPWTLSSEILKPKKKTKKKADSKETSLPVSVSRVVKFLNENKNKSFTNGEIAVGTGLSSSSVSGITDRLENIGAIRQGRNRKALDKTTVQTYQSALSGTGYSKERVGGQEVIVQVQEAFDKNKNQVYTRKEIQNLIKSTSEKVSKVIPILLITEKIKLVGFDKKKKVLQYQSIRGNKKAVKVYIESDENYINLKTYIEINNIKNDSKKIKALVAKEKGHSRLFYSNKGIVKEYEVSYLQKILGLGEKKVKGGKGLLERLTAWVRE